LAPWITSSGAVIWSAYVTGDRSRILAASLSGSPIMVATVIAQLAGMDRARVSRLAGPRTETPAAHRCGSRVRQVSAANPP
jgi:hypothetical protein